MRRSLVSLTFILLAAPAMAVPLLVDGNLNDWHVTVNDSKTSKPASVFSTVAVDQGKLYSYAIEDSNDLGGLGEYLGPHYGGQKYDVEFMAVAIVANRIHLAIVSGQRPDNGLQYFSPGDLRIVASNGITYGVEIGGGAGASKPKDPKQAAITEGAAGTTYVLNSSGVTSSVVATDGRQTAGSVWSNVSWINSPIANDHTPVQFNVNKASHLVGMADYIFTRDAFGSQHSIIEMSLDMAWFGGATNLDFFWGPSCDNDILTVHDDLPGNRVPLPGTLALLGLGMAGLTAARRNK